MVFTRTVLVSAAAVVVIVGTLSSASVWAQSGGAATEPWRSSWTRFVQAIEEWRSAGNVVPTASFDSLIKGDPVPLSLPVMKRFGGTVTFEGNFKGVITHAMMNGMQAKLDLDLPDSKGTAADHKFEGMAHVYPAAGAIDNWKAVKAGTAVRFRAVVKGVAMMEPSPGKIAYIVLLQDAQLVPK